MTLPRSPQRFRPTMRRVVVVLPSAFTFANLFFGIWALVLASRGEFSRAGWFIVFAGVLDLLDGRVARLTRTGTRFGAELDSLVDVISFGVAPAFLIYELHFSATGAGAWLFSFAYVAATATRLARFNVTQAGEAKRYFIGLPSPAAGMTLATYYPFTQTELYRTALAGVQWSLVLILLMVGLSALMVSQVRYPPLPRAGVRDARGLLGLAVILLILFFGIWKPAEFFFPLGIAYTLYGAGRAATLTLLVPPEEDEEAEIAGPIVIDDRPEVPTVPPAAGSGRP
jgi:CDP-diacylglycerol--serine O-phosphatidyltransferase